LRLRFKFMPAAESPMASAYPLHLKREIDRRWLHRFIPSHKFQVGEQVEVVHSATERFAADRIYEVVRQLPVSNGEFGYRIKNAREPYERVVSESRLRRLLDPT
jgi:hypothetical protein